MKKRALSMAVILAAVGFSVAAAEETAPAVPKSLQGDWIVKPVPSMNLPDRPATTIRIDANTYLTRIQKARGVLGVIDESGAWTVVEDADGKEYLQSQPYEIAARTNTMPWQIDLRMVKKDGAIIEKKGICSLKDGTVQLAIGKAGEERPTTFASPVVGGKYHLIEASRGNKKD